MNKNSLIISAFLIFVISVAGCTLSVTPVAPTQSNTQATSSEASVNSAPISLSSFESAIEALYTQTNQSVVNIDVIVPPSISNPGGGALGSGFVWDSQGNIVTNNHVVTGATRMAVTFYDGTQVDATLVGTDVDSDLAVIKVDTTGLGINIKPVTMGDSTQLNVGQLAIAIGNPFGLQGTMTVGFVSALGRILPSDLSATGPSYNIPDIIQTDASINPGNSGGILLDISGSVIGITQSIESASGTSAGVGFAIPAAIIKQVVPSLIQTGKYIHPYLGVTVNSLYPDLATAMKLPANQRGALIQNTAAGGPAEKAGLKASTTSATVNGQQVNVGGDVVIAYNGQTVKSSDDLITFLARTGTVGQNVTLIVIRGGNQMQVQVTLAARPAS